MRVLIAVDERRPTNHGDDGAAIDGELVTPNVLGCADASCEVCHGSWFGLASHGSVPTAMVVERPGVSLADLRGRIHDWLDCTGVIDRVVGSADELGAAGVDDPLELVDHLVADHLADIEEICATYPVGTVVSRLGTLVAPRPVTRAA